LTPFLRSHFQPPSRGKGHRRSAAGSPGAETETLRRGPTNPLSVAVDSDSRLRRIVLVPDRALDGFAISGNRVCQI